MSRLVGLDLGLKGKHRVAVHDGATPRGKPFTVEATREGVDVLLRRAQEGATGPVTFVMEPTGLAWLQLAAHIAAAGHTLLVSKPQKLSDLRKFYSKHTKTDSVDASTVARLPLLDPDGLHAMCVPTAEETTLRRLVKQRERLARQLGDHKRRIHAVMVIANPWLMAALGDPARLRCADRTAAGDVVARLRSEPAATARASPYRGLARLDQATLAPFAKELLPMLESGLDRDL